MLSVEVEVGITKEESLEVQLRQRFYQAEKGSIIQVDSPVTGLLRYYLLTDVGAIPKLVNLETGATLVTPSVKGMDNLFSTVFLCNGALLITDLQVVEEATLTITKYK